MATPEVPRRIASARREREASGFAGAELINSQAELYKKPKEEFDWRTLPAGAVEIKEDSFDRALRKILMPANFDALKGSDRELVRLTVSKQIAAIEAAAVHAGFDMSLARNGDTIALEGGVLYLDLKKGDKKLFLKLDANAASVRPGYAEIKPEAVEKSRRAWKSLQEGFSHGILTEILPALAGGERSAASFENRERIWSDIMKKTEDYKGMRDQNKEMIDYLKAEIAAGRSVDVVTGAPSAAPRRAKKKAKGDLLFPSADEVFGPEPKRKVGVPDTRTSDERYFDALKERGVKPPEAPDELDAALSKISELSRKADALDAKIQQLAELQKKAERNRSLEGSDLKMLRGSLTATRNKAMEIEQEVLALTGEVIQVKKALETIAKEKKLSSADSRKNEKMIGGLDETAHGLQEIFNTAKETWHWANALLNPRSANETKPL